MTVHGGLVLDELNDNFCLCKLRIARKRASVIICKYAIDIVRICDKDGNLRQSFLERRLIVSIDTKDGEARH